MPYLLIPALVWSFIRSQWMAIQLSVSAMIALFLSSALTLTRYPENTYRFVSLGVTLSAIPVGVMLAAFPSARMLANAEMRPRPNV